MFLGDYQHTLDAKGRVSLPAKFRAETTGKLVVSKGLDGCLWVFPADRYEEFADRLLSKDDFKQTSRKVQRYFMAGAADVELDSAGRISIPSVLREFAGLEKDLAVIGAGHRIEIWNADQWAAYNRDAAESIVDDAEELSELGFL
ncbi:MAG: division/cell wall cluster transcriptional repressor MraZ [Actinomycetota bacterium]|jgi:MraZ protein|nr:division/cell wall cluster transcriptional repressor MraZ [Actinomycetota bacterium]